MYTKVVTKELYSGNREPDIPNRRYYKTDTTGKIKNKWQWWLNNRKEILNLEYSWIAANYG